MAIRYIIQARMSSTRLPGKILMDIGGRVLIQHIIDRLLLSGADISEICFALADEGDVNLHEYLNKHNVSWITGDVDNVLSRYIKASDDMSEEDLIVRLTGDNPFIDFLCLQDNLKIFQNDTAIDFSYPYKLPLGMGFEIFTRKALVKQIQHTLQPRHTEHVTTFIKENNDLFNIRPINYYEKSPDIRLTIDYIEDMEQARKTCDYFKNKGKPDFCSEDVFHLYKTRPDFFSINQMMKQKDSKEYHKSTQD